MMIHSEKIKSFVNERKESTLFCSIFKNPYQSGFQVDKFLVASFPEFKPGCWELNLVVLASRFCLDGIGKFDSGCSIGRSFNQYSRLTASTVSVFDRLCLSSSRDMLIKRLSECSFIFSENPIDLTKMVIYINSWTYESRSIYYEWMKDFENGSSLRRKI